MKMKVVNPLGGMDGERKERKKKKGRSERR